MKLKTFILILGIVLVIGGIGTFGYNRFSYTTEENVAEIGVKDVASIKLTAEKEKHISVPPAVSGLSLAVGIIFIIIGIRRSNA